ncbi:MAG: DUF1634 domain-containing protein [Cuspidothrix sp.]
MYKLNSGFPWTSSTTAEVINLAFESQPQDCHTQELEHETQINIPLAEIINNQKLTKSVTEKKLEYLLSNLLQYGVLTASFVVLLGGILYLINHSYDLAEYQVFVGTDPQFQSPIGIFNAVLAGSYRGIIQLGLLLLIAIPILRVIISFLTFLLQKEFIYVIITLLVLVSLTYSLVGAYY